MNNELFTVALGLSEPWVVTALEFDQSERKLIVRVDFRRGARFAHGDAEGVHPVHDTLIKSFRHLSFFQHECELVARVPRVRLPDGRVALVEPPWAGRRSGFTLLFEALVVTLCQQMPFAAAARLARLSPHRAQSICACYVDMAVAQTDLSETSSVAIDETSRARGHNYVTVAADANARRVVFVGEGRSARTVGEFADALEAHGGDPKAVESVSIDMSPAFISGVAEHLPNADITFDKFHVVAHASKALDATRRIEQRSDPDLKGLRWTLPKNPGNLGPAQRAELDALLANVVGKRTARAWMYREQLREILNRKQIHVVRAMLHQWRQREPLQGRAHEGRRQDDPKAHPWNRCLGQNTPHQRLHRGTQRAVPVRQAPRQRLPLLQDHPHRLLPHRREARLRQTQPPCRLTHTFFGRADLKAMPAPSPARPAGWRRPSVLRAGGAAWLAILASAWSLPAADPPARWSRELLRQPEEWYASGQALEAARAVVRRQTPEGGWPKNADLLAPPPSSGAIGRPTIDNGATVSPMRFLALVIDRAGGQELRRSFERGFDYLLAAQYPNGGWPQIFPLQEGYTSRITFNDDAMANVLALLDEAARGKAPFGFLDRERRGSASAAVARGIDAVLRCQVRREGRPVAWCAQHDEETLEPAWGRAYEPPSLSGGETVGIVRFLMSVEEPSPGIVAAIEGAVEWLRSAAMDGVRVRQVSGPGGLADRILIEDPDAPPLWARFYELGTGRPLYLDRDSVYRYDFSEIGPERRRGYSYHGYWAASLLESEYPRWRALHGARQLPPGRAPAR